MKLSKLLKAAGIEAKPGGADPNITAVVEDSRRVSKGALFVAYKGVHDDGGRYIKAAVAKGAVAVAAEGKRTPPAGAVLVPVKNGRHAAADLARAFHGNPGAKLRLAAVTGTKGKTTTTFLVRAVAEAAGEATGLSGTVATVVGGELRLSTLTTPGASDLQASLAAMVAAGAKAAVVEVSSHAIDQGRVAGLSFDSAIFTNLYPDHLDYHRDMESYFAVKSRLFVGDEAARDVVVNADDAYGRKLLLARPDAMSFGEWAEAPVRAERIEADARGVRVVMTTPAGRLTVDSPLLGRYNAWNLMAAAAWGLKRGFELPVIGRALESVKVVPGRMERVDAGQEYLAVVDFSHTGPALEAALKALRALTRSRLIVVFGCGGDRDPDRRRTMGEAAAKLADVAIITSDNPRDEDPLKIIASIERAARSAHGPACRMVFPDRTAAIGEAVKMADKGDVVLVAGKGHETVQIVGAKRIPFDDREVLKRAIAGKPE